MEKKEFEDFLEKDLPYFEEHCLVKPAAIEKIKEYTLENEHKSASMIQGVLQSVGTVAASVLIGVSLIFIMAITDVIDFGSGESFFYFIFFFSAVYFIPAVLFIYKKLNAPGETLYTLALILMTVAFSVLLLGFEEQVLFLYIICLILIVIPYIFLHLRGFKIVLSLFFQLITALFIIKFLYELDLFSGYRDNFLSSACLGCLILTALNGIFLAVSFQVTNKVTGYYSAAPLKYNSFFYLSLFFLMATFFETDEKVLYYIINILYFVLSTGAVIFFVKKDIRIFKQVSILMWAVFIFYKYYDIFWSLFHKSLVLILLGLLFYAAATGLALQWKVFKKDDK